MDRDRAELGSFLRSRRDRISPAQAGMEAFPGPRRVPGLRRDELAYLAGLSPDYLSRVEQGRQRTVSAGVLDALAGALRLDDAERAHLHQLASPPSSARTAPDVAQRPDPGLLRVMTAVDHLPVLLLGRRAEVLARNAMLQSLLGRPLEPGTSLAAYLFLDPSARARISNWESFAKATVGALRREAGQRPGDARLATLIDQLRQGDPDAERWWADQTVRDYTSVDKRIDHPEAGPLQFAIEIVMGPHDPDQRLVIYTAEPDSATAEALPFLASWSSEEAARRV